MSAVEFPRSNDRLIDLATGVLSANPAASMQDVALAAGMSRATLHRRFPSREALLTAIAAIAIAELHRVTDGVAGRGLHGRAALDALLEEAVSLAPRFGFLSTDACLENDPSIMAAAEVVFATWEQWAYEGQRQGELRVDVPARWIVNAMHGLVMASYDAVRMGEIASRDAVRLVRLTLFGGLAETPSAAPHLRSVSPPRSI